MNSSHTVSNNVQTIYILEALVMKFCHIFQLCSIILIRVVGSRFYVMD